MSAVPDLPSRRDEAWRWADLDAIGTAAAQNRMIDARMPTAETSAETVRARPALPCFAIG